MSTMSQDTSLTDVSVEGTKAESSTVNMQQRNSKRPPEYTSAHYERIEKRGNYIRVLKLFSSNPNNPHVECELITTSLDDEIEHPYEALSWCWGTLPQIAYINIRKGRRIYAKYVKPDLVSALRALRHYQNDRYLWIDAVCINQNHPEEKNHQVEMMSVIYGKAERVCIWLGDPTKSSRLALSFIKNEVLQLQNFDDLCDKKADTMKWNALLELMQRPWFSRRWVVQEVSLAQRALIYCGSDKISWRKFAIAVELFVEVETATHRLSEVMKKDPRYYHVPGWFEYVSALGASLLVDATGRLFRDYKELQQSAKSPVGQVDLDSDLEVDSDLEALTDDESEVGSLHVTANPQIVRGQPLLSLEYLVSSLSIFDTSVEHDTIYALLAIAKDTTPRARQGSSKYLDHTQDALERFTQKKRYNVDYGQPYVDACKDFIQFCINRSLHTDPSRALDILFRPWATEERKISERRNAKMKAKRREHAKQETVPEKKIEINCSEANTQASTPQKEASRKQKRKRANNPPMEKEAGRKQKRKRANSLPMDEEEIITEDDYIPLPSWIPQLSGAPFAMYSQAGIPGLKMGRKNADPLVGLPSLTHRNYNAAETKKIDMKTFRFRKRTSHGLKHFSLYIKGFIFDTIDKVQSSSQGGAIPSEWADFGGWPLGGGIPPEEFWRTIVADRGRDGKNPPVYYARACKESFEKGGYVSGAINTTDLINNERCSVIAQFCRRVQAVIWNRALVRTTSGKLGLAGPNVQPGDRICILYGCSVPVILRKSDKKENEVMDKEVTWELQYLKEKFAECCRSYVRRKAYFKEKWEKDKAEYKKWESTKREEWKRSKGSKDWRKKWKEDTKEREKLAKSLMVKKSIDDLKTREDYVQHFRKLFLYSDLRIDREFNAWKRKKRAERKEREKQREGDKKRTLDEENGWNEPKVNWREFELLLKFFRRWKKKVRDVKEGIRKEVEAEVKKRMEDRNAKGHKKIQEEGLEKGQEESREEGHEEGQEDEELLQVQRKEELTEKQKEEYEKKLRENIQKALGDDRFWYYQLLGECYIHGMMDGEAMSVQNGNSGDEDAKPIPAKVFEIR